jgi:hypothetical protein
MVDGKVLHYEQVYKNEKHAIVENNYTKNNLNTGLQVIFFLVSQPNRR